MLGRLPLLLAFCLIVNVGYSQTTTISNISVQQRTDGSGIVDVSFTLTGSSASYNVLLEASFDGGNNYTPVPSQYLSGDVSGLSPGNRHIVWNGLGSFLNTFSTQTKIKILANEAGAWQPGNGVTDIDGNFYPSVIIGNQEWMAENLRVTRDANGNNITRYCHRNNTTNCDLYGGLYTWPTVMNGSGSSNTNPSNVQGICPTGWHVPSDAEWTELEDYLVAQGYPNSNVVNGAGNALKSCRQVSSPLGGDCATSEHPRWNSHSTHYGTDEFGFSALPGGYRQSNGTYSNLGLNGYWWSSSEYSTTFAFYRYLSNGNGWVYHIGSNKDLGLSVRCVRDN